MESWRGCTARRRDRRTPARARRPAGDRYRPGARGPSCTRNRRESSGCEGACPPRRASRHGRTRSRARSDRPPAGPASLRRRPGAPARAVPDPCRRSGDIPGRDDRRRGGHAVALAVTDRHDMHAVRKAALHSGEGTAGEVGVAQSDFRPVPFVRSTGPQSPACGSPGRAPCTGSGRRRRTDRSRCSRPQRPARKGVEHRLQCRRAGAGTREHPQRLRKGGHARADKCRG